jgi:hypothetical protein
MVSGSVLPILVEFFLGTLHDYSLEPADIVFQQDARKKKSVHRQPPNRSCMISLASLDFFAQTPGARRKGTAIFDGARQKHTAVRPRQEKSWEIFHAKAV